MKNANKVIFLFLIASSLSSCSLIFVSAYGIKWNVKSYSKDELLEKARTLEIAQYPLYQAKPALNSLLDSIFQLDSSYFNTAKSLYQPLQLVTFDKSGKLIGAVANCDAGGYPNLNWGHLLDKYPASSYYFVDSFPLSRSTYLTKLNKINTVELNHERATSCVIYTHFMGRQNKRFLESAFNYHKTYAAETQLVFVNYDLEEFYE
jgi:hypothetical protein